MCSGNSAECTQGYPCSLYESGWRRQILQVSLSSVSKDRSWSLTPLLKADMLSGARGCNPGPCIFWGCNQGLVCAGGVTQGLVCAGGVTQGLVCAEGVTRGLYVLGKHSVPELHPQPLTSFLGTFHDFRPQLGMVLHAYNPTV